VTAVSFSLLFLLAAFARPAIAQSDENATSDSGTPGSRLYVSTESIDYHVNIDTGMTSETRHFQIENKGRLALHVTVGSPSGGNFVITAPPLVTPAGGTITIAGKEAGKDSVQKVAVQFNADGPGRNIDATIAITSDATKGPTSATIKLHANARQNATPTATLTATPTMTPTPTPTPTATCTPAAGATPFVAGLALIAGGQASDGTALNSAEVFNPATNNFRLTTALGGSTMNDGRYGHTATTTSTAGGATVLLTGGFDALGVTNSIELYVNSSNEFLLGGTMIDARQGHTATFLGGTDQILIAGGQNAGGTVLNTAELLSTPLVATMNTPRVNAAASIATIPPPVFIVGCPGPAVVTGGSNGTSALQTAELFDPVKDTFTLTDDASLGGSQMNAARTHHTATFLANSGTLKVLIAGGAGADGVSQASAEIFDPATNKFTLTTALGGTNMNDARANHTATAIGQTMVLIAGGTDSSGHVLATAELFDLSNNSFTRIGSMNSARRNHAAVNLANGKILITGGEDASGTTLATAEVFDPGTNTFTLTTDPSLGGNNMNVARKLHTATAY
jgi:hypothetical protein